MIQFNKVFLADVKDDFELAGKGEKEFSIYDFICNDLSIAFSIGYGIKDWNLWIPIKVRKELRHCSDNLEKYNPQLKWLNSKIKNADNIETYVNYIIDNLFCDDKRDLINIVISLGSKLRNEQH